MPIERGLSLRSPELRYIDGSTAVHAPLRCLLGRPFRPFGRGLFRNGCFLFHGTLFRGALFHRMFDSRRLLGRFFRSRMFDMNPFNISRRRMLLRPFEGRLKWNRLHKQQLMMDDPGGFFLPDESDCAFRLIISVRCIHNQAWWGGDENVEITNPNARPRKQCRHVRALPLRYA